MSFLYIILLGLVQGILQFLPVSTSGHIVVLENLLGIDSYTGLPLAAFLYLGSLAAIIWGMKKDILRLLLEFCRIIYDILTNLRIYMDNRKTGRNNAYRRLIHNNYQKLVVLLLVTSIPTMILGFLSRELAGAWGSSLLFPAIGFLISGVVLLVVDFIKKGNKIPRDTGYDCAMWIGICQGLSVFPGVSRMGLAVSAGLLNGLSPSFAVRYSILASVPAILGAFFVEVPHLGQGNLTPGLFFAFLLGTVVAAVTGMLVMRWMLRIVQRAKLRIFAYYSFLIGIAVLAVYLVR